MSTDAAVEVVPDPEQQPLFTVEQAGSLLGIGRSAAYAEVKAGRLPTVLLGRRMMVPAARLMPILEASPHRSRSLADRLNRHIDRQSGPDACWTWTGSRDRNGYGRMWIRVNGRRVTVRAHRVSYEQFIGPIPVGLEIDHLCRVRHCVNPAHLEAVPKIVNILRGESLQAKNARKTHCEKGHPFDKENTAFRRRSDGQVRGRVCRICQRERRRLARLQRKARRQ